MIKELINLAKPVKRIPYRLKNYGWHITIDDGYCAYRYPLKVNTKNYSIDILYEKIVKAVNKWKIK